jgi:hypothetical protein
MVNVGKKYTKEKKEPADCSLHPFKIEENLIAFLTNS